MRTLLKCLFLGTLIFIPLYPKFPLFDIEFTYLYIRFDDVYIALLYSVFAFLVIFKKVKLPHMWAWAFMSFWLVVLTSYAFNFFISHQIPSDLKYIGLMHALRRVQYMGLFFVGYTIVHEHISRLSTVMHTIVITLIGVNIYGWGQRIGELFSQPVAYLQQISHPLAQFFATLLTFPAVSTMNPEFARGHLLVLGPWARITSTFAGHYDLAAYLVFIMPLVIGFFVDKKRNVHALISYISSIFILIFTASRISFLVFIIVMPVFFFLSRKWVLLIVTLCTVVFAMQSSGTMQQRFAESFKSKQVFLNATTGQEIIDQKITTQDLPAGNVFISQSKTKQLSSLDKEKLKAQLIEKEIDEAKKTGHILTQAEAAMLVQKKYKDLSSFITQNVVATDISASTRFQVEWPRALQALSKNILIGTGPSSITESTDGDYMRWLGEFGILGFALFTSILTMLLIYTAQTKPAKRLYMRHIPIIAILGICSVLLYHIGTYLIQHTTIEETSVLGRYLIIIFDAPVYTTLAIACIGSIVWYLVVYAREHEHYVNRYVYLGFLCGTLALFLNASYIDVFEASKVAYMFWAIAGSIIGAHTNCTYIQENTVAYTNQESTTL